MIDAETVSPNKFIGLETRRAAREEIVPATERQPDPS